VRGLKKVFAVQACAAAVMAALSTQSSGQISLEHALGNNRDAITTYNQIQAGLDRAGRAPLETVWLRAEALEELWEKNPALSQAFQGCGKAGTPKEGCMVSGRTFWRFTLAPSFNAFAPGLSAHALRAAPSDADAAPMAGGVYLVANAGAIGQRGGAVLLAAGATAQLIDTAYPSVLIEVTAPKDEPLFLGNLAASDIGKALAILARQQRNTPAPVQLASLARNPVVPAAPRLDDWTGGEMPQPMQVAVAEPRLDDWTGGELPTILAATVALVEAAPEKPMIAPKPIVVAVTAPPASATHADIARMRAEVEAEVARERERLAQQVQSRATRRASFGT
jgi:hypothetical protein